MLWTRAGHRAKTIWPTPRWCCELLAKVDLALQGWWRAGTANHVITSQSTLPSAGAWSVLVRHISVMLSSVFFCSSRLGRYFSVLYTYIIIQGGIFRKRVIFLGYRGVSPKHTEQRSLAKSMFTLSQSQSDTSSCEVWRTRTVIQGVESWKTAQYAFAKSRVEPN